MEAGFEFYPLDILDLGVDFTWQRHALERMMERGISRNTVINVLLAGEVIEDYSDDKPFPSALFLG